MLLKNGNIKLPLPHYILIVIKENNINIKAQFLTLGRKDLNKKSIQLLELFKICVYRLVIYKKIVIFFSYLGLIMKKIKMVFIIN